MELTIGMDVGGTKIAGGVVNDQGVILERARRDTPRHDAEAIEAAIVDLVRELASRWKVDAVGIGAAGLIDERRSRVVVAPNLGWADEPLRLAVEKGSGLPVVVENDANAAAWGEYRFGGGRESEHLVCVTVGTGIGGALVIEGELYRGAHGMAAEFGHMTIKPGGRLCGCGNRGCWEQYASGNALVREARRLAAERRGEAEGLLDLGDGTPEGVEGRHVTEAAASGDPVALAAFDCLARWLGLGMADLTAALDPDRFMLGGGVSEAGGLLLAPTRRAFLESVSGREYRQLPTVKLAELGNEAGLIGAACLAREL